MTYTTTVNTDTAAIPTYIGNCRQDPARVSSACSCLQRRYWIDQTRSEVGSGLVDPTGPDRLADLVDPDQYQIDLVGTGH
jgi:hypothetical protein